MSDKFNTFPCSNVGKHWVTAPRRFPTHSPPRYGWYTASGPPRWPISTRSPMIIQRPFVSHHIAYTDYSISRLDEQECDALRPFVRWILLRLLRARLLLLLAFALSACVTPHYETIDCVQETALICEQLGTDEADADRCVMLMDDCGCTEEGAQWRAYMRACIADGDDLGVCQHEVRELVGYCVVQKRMEKTSG